MGTLGTAILASASGLNAERTRIEVAVSNLANAESTQGPDGKPYRRRDVVLSAAPNLTFDAALGRANAVGVHVAAVTEDQGDFKHRYDPSHPDADKDGFVSTPNVDVPEEMVDMLSASRAYQANLTAVGIVQECVRKALELGKA